MYLAEEKPLDIIGISNIHLKMSNESIRKIQKVRHVPRLMRNLISIGHLDDGHNVTLASGLWKVNKNSLVVALGS